MLCLSRKVGEKIRICDTITVVVLKVSGEKIQLGLDAPANIEIHREEVWQRLHQERRAA
ncbi:MAG: carbon storage regulator CsrA [Pirellulales bacterium]